PAARTRSCSRSPSSTTRSRRRACRTRSSSTAIRSRRWRACDHPRSDGQSDRRRRCRSGWRRSPVSGGTRRDDLVRRWRATSGRGRKLRGLVELLRPYRGRTLLMFVSLVIATAAALAPPPLAALAIDKGITPGNMTALTWIVGAFLVTAVAYWGATYAQTYLVGWIGQRALQDLRIQLFQ